MYKVNVIKDHPYQDEGMEQIERFKHEYQGNLLEEITRLYPEVSDDEAEDYLTPPQKLRLNAVNKRKPKIDPFLGW